MGDDIGTHRHMYTGRHYVNSTPFSQKTMSYNFLRGIVVNSLKKDLSHTTASGVQSILAYRKIQGRFMPVTWPVANIIPTVSAYLRIEPLTAPCIWVCDRLRIALWISFLLQLWEPLFFVPKIAFGVGFVKKPCHSRQHQIDTEETLTRFPIQVIIADENEVRWLFLPFNMIETGVGAVIHPWLISAQPRILLWARLRSLNEGRSCPRRKTTEGSLIPLGIVRLGQRARKI